MTTQDPPLYHVFARIHLPKNSGVVLEVLGIPPRAGHSTELRLLLDGRITEAEHRDIFGPDRPITTDMCYETSDQYGYTISVFLSDVLACERGLRSHQAALINHLLHKTGRPELDEQAMLRRAKAYGDITPPAAALLLETADSGMNWLQANLNYAEERMKTLNLTLEDLLNPEIPENGAEAT